MKKLNISFILDETGSMTTIKQQTISGFNEYVDSLEKDNATKNALFTLTKFNSNRVIVVHDSVALKDVVRLNNDNYTPDMLTPLYDAIGKTISSIEKIVKGKNKQNVIVVIQTDGLENASVEYNQRSIFDKIAEKKKLGWAFVFLGANQDAWATSQMLGVSAGNTMSYSGEKTRGAFKGVTTSTLSYARSNGSQTENLISSDGSVKIVN